MQVDASCTWQPSARCWHPHSSPRTLPLPLRPQLLCRPALLLLLLHARTQVFGLMNLIIERLGEDITLHVQGLLPLLPQIWQEANDQSLLRIQVSLGFVY